MTAARPSGSGLCNYILQESVRAPRGLALMTGPTLGCRQLTLCVHDLPGRDAYIWTRTVLRAASIASTTVASGSQPPGSAEKQAWISVVRAGALTGRTANKTRANSLAPLLFPRFILAPARDDRL